jgi:hypothetical protein
VRPGASFALSFGLKVGERQPGCNPNAPVLHHRTPMMQLDNLRAWVAFAPRAATSRTGGGQGTREGVEVTAVFVHEVSILRGMCMRPARQRPGVAR